MTGTEKRGRGRPKGKTQPAACDAPLSDQEIVDLPAVVSIVTAGRALGLHANTSRQLAASGNFPVPILQVGSRRKVAKHQLMAYLGLRPTA